MQWSREDVEFLAVLLPVGILIGWFETTRLQTEKRWNLKKNRYGYYIKRNTPYVVGWILTVVLGVFFSVLAAKGSFFDLFSKKIFETLFEEFDPLLVFTSSRPWYLWALTGSSSVSFTLFARRVISREEKSASIRIVTKEEVLKMEEEKKREKEKNGK